MLIADESAKLLPDYRRVQQLARRRESIFGLSAGHAANY
jgi:hypothetical protein